MHSSAFVIATVLIVLAAVFGVVKLESEYGSIFPSAVWPGDTAVVADRAVAVKTNGHESALGTGEGHAEHTIAQDRALHGKPGADVGLTSLPLQIMELHQQQTIDLSLISPFAYGTLHVELSTSTGLSLVSDQRQWHFQLNPQNRHIEMPIRVYAESEGRQHVHLLIHHTDADGHTTSRALATEVRVGALNQAKMFAKGQQTGPHYRSLPAHETIE